MRSFCLLILILGGCAFAPKVREQNTLDDGLDCKNSQIVGGRPVLVGEASAKEAVLLLVRRTNKISACTAVPIGAQYLLTAAHCVEKAAQNGVTAIFHTDMKCASGYTRNKTIVSTSFAIHQSFDGSPQSMHDIAVIKLSKPVPAEYPIPKFYQVGNEVTNDEVFLLGYGITDESLQDSLELRTTVKKYSRDVVIRKEIIGISQSEKSGGFCRGDSGAPVYVMSGGSKKLIGINSFNIGTTNKRECHTASAGMYIPYFSGWIKDQILAL